LSEIWGDKVWEVLMFCEREIEEKGERDAGRGFFRVEPVRCVGLSGRVTGFKARNHT